MVNVEWRMLNGQFTIQNSTFAIQHSSFKRSNAFLFTLASSFGRRAVIDIHFHCLPGIDDGPSSFDEAVELCRAAAAEGTETIVAPPHVMRDPWLNEDPAERDRLLVRLNALLGGKPAVVPGCEYFFASEILELWERGSDGPLIGLNRGSALLIEFPAYAVPTTAEFMFHELSVMNVQ